MEKYISFILIGTTIFSSWKAWKDTHLFHRLKFQTSAILEKKQYDRMLFSGFIHADSIHLFFNMFVLYNFMPIVLAMFSPLFAILLYLLSILGGSLLTLLFHREDSWYSAVGASAGVSGIVFSSLIMFPNLPLRIIFFPFFSFPGWLFGLIFLGYSLFGMKNNFGNLGHAAHLGGSLVGVLFTISSYPSALYTTPPLFLLGITLIFILMLSFAYRNK